MISWFSRSRIRSYVKLSTKKQNKMKQEIRKLSTKEGVDSDAKQAAVEVEVSRMERKASMWMVPDSFNTGIILTSRSILFWANPNSQSRA